MYQWWVFVHLVGVFVFVAAHGVSMFVLFRLRKERDPQKVSDLLAASSSSMTAFYWGLGLLLLGGIVAGFVRHWWRFAWIWAAVGVLVVVTLAMYAMARPYYRRVAFVARAMASGSQAVTSEQFDEILRGPRPVSVAAIGVVGLLVILYLMVLKPSLGFSTGGAPAVTPSGPAVTVTAKDISFDTDTLRAPADQPFFIVFDNRDAQPHNVAIYTDSSASSLLFVGPVFTGPDTVTYPAPALPAGSYYFRCDVHPQMDGTFIVEATGSPEPSEGA